MRPDFPSVDRNHLISSASKELFVLLRPSTWEYQYRDGDSDFGLDIEIQVAPQAQVNYTFRVQLKGTEEPSILADGQTLAIKLRRTTLNLYANILEPVMLTVAVVKLGANGKPDLDESKIYWQWLPLELYRLRGSAFAIDRSDQEHVTVHVPIANERKPGLDVVPYLRRRLDEARAVESLGDLVRTTIDKIAGPADAPIQHLLSVFARDPSRLQSVLSLDQDDAYTITTHGPGPRLLIAEGLSHIKVGKTLLAEEVVRGIEAAEVDANPALKASLLMLQGKIAMQRMRKGEALQFFEQAYRVSPEEQYLLAEQEVRFLDAVDRNDSQAIATIKEALASVRTDDGLSLLARVSVFLGEFEVAGRVIGRISESKRTLPTVISLSVQDKWDDVERYVDRATSHPGVSISEAIGLHLIAARARAGTKRWRRRDFPHSGTTSHCRGRRA